MYHQATGGIFACPLTYFLKEISSSDLVPALGLCTHQAHVCPAMILSGSIWKAAKEA